MFRRKIIRNQEVPAYPDNQYFDAPMSSEAIQRVIDETYLALVKKRESNQPLTEEELIQFESLSTKVSPNLARAYETGGYIRKQDDLNAYDMADDARAQGYQVSTPISPEGMFTSSSAGNLVGIDQPGYGGFAGPGLPEGMDDDQDGLPNFNDSNPNMQGGDLINLSTNPVEETSAQNYSNTTTDNTTTGITPFVPGTNAGMPNMQQFNPYQNVGFGLATALTSNDSGERRAGTVLTGLAGASSLFDLSSNLALGAGSRKQMLNQLEESDRAAGIDFQAPIMSQTQAAEAGRQRDSFAQDGAIMYKKGGKAKKKNKPNDPALWSRAIAAAKNKFDVYPSAYANAWAVQWYKKKGGTWRKAQDGFVFEEGGKITIEEQLSGRHVTGIARPALSGTEINAELEKNEYIEYPEEQKISKVIGKSHAQGGEKMNLEPGTRILSDNIKVGKEYQRILSELFDMKNIKSDDTVAKVMEKYLQKSGVTDIQKRQEDALAGVKKNMSVKDEATRMINEQFYADKIIESQSELNEKQKEQTMVFNILFEMQEARKSKNEEGDPSAKNIRKRPPLEQEFVPYEGPPPVEEEAAVPVEIAMENGGTIDILLDGTKIYASPEAIEIVRRDALEGGYGDFTEYLSENVIGKYADGGGIPERYKKKGFTKVGVKKRAPSGSKHKWEVLARKKVGGKTRYKIVKGGFRGMKDFTQHKDRKRQKSFWDRMGGKNSAKAKDPFSPLYWHKRFGTWEDGGKLEGNKDFKPHWMYDPNNPNKAEFAEKYEDHVRLDKLGYVHEKPNIEDFAYGGMKKYQNANQVEIIVDAQGNRYIPAFADRETGEIVYIDENGQYVVNRQMPVENSTFSANAQGIYGAGLYGYDELDETGRTELDKRSAATASFVTDQYNKAGNVEGLTVNVFGASSKTPVSSKRQKKIFDDLGYEQIGTNKNRYRVPDLANDPTGQTFVDVTITEGPGASSDLANYGLSLLRIQDQKAKLTQDLLASGVPQEQIDQINFQAKERSMIGPEYAGGAVGRQDPTYMPYQNSGFSVELSEQKEGMVPYGYLEDIPQQIGQLPSVDFSPRGASFNTPYLDLASDIVRPSIGVQSTPLLQQPLVDLQAIKFSEEQALREGAAAANVAMTESANRGGPEARTMALGSQSVRSAFANEATRDRQQKDAEALYKTELAEAQLNSAIGPNNLNHLLKYSSNALTALDNEISEIANFEKNLIERADQKQKTSNMFSVMGQFAPNFNVGPGGAMFNPMTQDNILYPTAVNLAQQMLAQSAMYSQGESSSE
jgi:hypothetical protein